VYESYATVWEQVADAIPDAPAVVQGERLVTYGELEARAARLAGAWTEAGVGPGAHVALYLHNCVEYLECLFACSKLRAVPVNVNFRYLDHELAYLVANADAEVLVYHRSLAEHVSAARRRMPKVHTYVEVDDAEPYAALAPGHEPMARIARTGHDLVLWYTGGTTGMPKGVLWEQGTLLDFGLRAAYTLQDERMPDSVAGLVADVRRWRGQGTSLGALLTTPLIHATAVHQANTALAVGGTVILLERGQNTGHAVCAAIARERPRILQVVGDVVVRRVVSELDAADTRGEPYDLSSLQRIHNSGAMVSGPLKNALLSRGTMHFYDSLGATEGVGFGVGLTTEVGTGESGRFRLGPNARVLNEDLRDVVPGSGEPGTLAVRSSCGIGYYNDPERTASTFRVIDAVRYAVPGDWATVDVDGTLTLLGRGSQCINSGGEKVWPEEVETVLKEHPRVADAAVVGVPDDEWGEIVGAVVATRGDPTPSASELAQWISTRLAGYKRPRTIAFRDEVRRNAIGKLDYAWARQTLEEDVPEEELE
jgi:acyl-CoA synthetase (AMP-forming)/AMP-acid ligase II